MSDARIIAIETSGRHGSVALARGPIVVAERGFSTNREHARELLPTLDGLFREQGWMPGEIDQCYVSIGPGSFTGLRVAVTFARHLAIGSKVKVCAVPTLDVIAENAAVLDSPPPHLVVVLDAKRGQVFAAVYTRLGMSTPGPAAAGGLESATAAGQAASPTRAYRRIVEPCLIEPARLLADAPRPLAVIGEGIEYHRPAIDASGAMVLDPSLWPPRAGNVHRVGWGLAQAGQFTPPRMLVPFYLRRPEAEELWEKRHGGGGKC